MKIIILGPQGSGKGTQAALIVKKFKIPSISPGEMLREEVGRNTPQGRRIAKVMNKGLMVPDEITNRLIKQKLRSQECRRGAILDGYPRRMAQARFLQAYWNPDHVIFLDISKKEIAKRLKDRLVCIGCKIIFHKVYKPSELKDLCDACGGRLEKRKDDRPSAIRQRLKIYRQETVPVIKFYEKLGLVRYINGERDIKVVWKDIQKTLSIKH